MGKFYFTVVSCPFWELIFFPRVFFFKIYLWRFCLYYDRTVSRQAAKWEREGDGIDVYGK